MRLVCRRTQAEAPPRPRVPVPLVCIPRAAHAFSVYSTVDETDATDAKGRVQWGSASLTLMNLTELLELLRDANILDDGACTVRTVTSFFVLVNIDDEIYQADLGPRADKSDNPAELSMDEFMEICARICNVKLADRDPDEPFEMVLETWLGLFFAPAVNNAAKRREASGMSKRKRRLSKRVAKKAQLSADVQGDGEKVFIDPNARFVEDSQ